MARTEHLFRNYVRNREQYNKHKTYIADSVLSRDPTVSPVMSVGCHEQPQLAVVIAWENSPSLGRMEEAIEFVENAMLYIEQRSPRTYTVMLLRYMVGMSSREISEMLGISEGAVRRRLRYGIKLAERSGR